MSPEGSGECVFCGRPAPKGEVACCTGCDLARRLPLGEKDLPATWQLGVLLGWLFVYFNEILFASMTLLSVTQGELERTGTFRAISFVAGGLTLVANLALFLLAKPKRGTDWAAVFGSLIIVALGAWSLAENLTDGFLYSLVVLNLFLIIWLTRGLWLRRHAKRA